MLWDTVITRCVRSEVGGEDKALHVLRSQAPQIGFPIHPHTVHSCDYMDISMCGNMPKISDSLRSQAKPQHSSARNFSPEAPALLAACIQLPASLCSLNGEKNFVQGAVDKDSSIAVMSSSARTLGDETGMQLLHILNQHHGKLFVPSSANHNQVSAGGG